MTTLDLDHIARWFRRERPKRLPVDNVMELYFTFHPRIAFLKTLPEAAEVVDIGAGDGSLSVFRSWPAPARPDLKLYAYSLEKGEHFDKFDGFAVGDWNTSPPDFDGRRFDAILCAHFIEHIADPLSLVAWAREKLRPGGRIYLEWPSPHSLDLPRRGELEAAGIPMIISHFHDDGTHRDLPDREVVRDGYVRAGFVIEAEGIVRLPWLEDEMLAHFRDAEDGFARQAAFWSFTNWSQYLVISKPHAVAAAPEGSVS
jgi:2-polyprenyl-3-methyl-5-hydroxy-6-metoxy-1,4-benzoquinol methylase